jgi:hypothetical protein
MGLSKRGWLLALTILIVGSTSALAQSRIQLVQGRRAVKDKITFIVEVSREKTENPRYAAAPDLQIHARFMDHPASGLVYLDGKALGRFDESMSFNSNFVDITYGRHTMTMVVTSPAVVFDFSVDVRGGVTREIIDGDELVVPKSSVLLEQRIFDLERKVHELEAEIATLKKNRVQ